MIPFTGFVSVFTLHNLASVFAIFLASVVMVRAVCVCHSATPTKHKSRLMFIGFGYSYVVLGFGALISAGEICSMTDMGVLPHWLLLGGSCGLILFDRRRHQCWHLTDCPAEDKAGPAGGMAT